MQLNWQHNNKSWKSMTMASNFSMGYREARNYLQITRHLQVVAQQWKKKKKSSEDEYLDNWKIIGKTFAAFGPVYCKNTCIQLCSGAYSSSFRIFLNNATTTKTSRWLQEMMNEESFVPTQNLASWSHWKKISPAVFIQKNSAK